MRSRAIVLVATLMLLLACDKALTAGLAAEWGERQDGGYYRLVDLDGKFITETALDIGKGDIYISESNDRYIVDHFDGDTVYARHDGKEKMPVISDKLSGTALIMQWAAQFTGSNQSKRTIGIYQTHSDESYQPSSGTESKTPRGDIYSVGQTLAKDLEAKGYKVQYSDDVFLPHDGQAYMRSRRVAAQLAKERPQTIIDVHRDAIPDPRSYITQVNGEQMTKVRLVVGRQNQNRDANLAYAKRIKAVADQKYPGLIKGIFHARGNYNQDLGPRTILLEFGTHTTTLQEAERSAKLMADVIPAAAGMAPGTAGAANRQIGGAAMNTLWWILGIAVVGGLGYVFLNKEGFRRMLGGSGPQAGGALGAKDEKEKIADDAPSPLGEGALGRHRKAGRHYGRKRR